jgi:hypothetical protein
MYDNGATDSNNVPREGCVIASHWVIPNQPVWGLAAGLRFGTAAGPYFRTAVHEIGHAMGLYHNTSDMGIMNTTDVIAASAVPPVQFPNNIQWSHAPDDQKRLRHMPDVWVRPGGIPFGFPYSSTPISPDDLVTPALGLAVEVAPLMPTVPIGAPVRIEFALANITEGEVPAPASLSLKTCFVKGKVIDPSGTVRRFLPLVLCVDEEPLEMLEAGGRVSHDATLLRGPQGALFPMAGPHRIIVEIEWQLGGVVIGAIGETTVMVTPAENEAHAEAANRVLATPDTLLTLAIGGDHLPQGVAALQVAIGDEVLRPHFALVEAKRLADSFFDRPPHLDEAADLLEDAIATPAEVASLARIARGSTSEAESAADVSRIRRVLESKADKVGVSDETRRLIQDV